MRMDRKELRDQAHEFEVYWGQSKLQNSRGNNIIGIR